jgi:two-component system chemotaxis response regulator CheB
MRNVIVIGASAGGISAIKELLSGLPADIDAALFVVQHLAQTSDAVAIAEIFQKKTALTCVVAKDGMAITRGFVYLAPPNHHLLVGHHLISVTSGPHENQYRPSIDALFRSAAVSFGHRVISVVLTGMLEDGTSGTSAVKRCGGTCIVQAPSDAQFPSMPTSVLSSIAIDYLATLSDIPNIISDIVQAPLPPKLPIPRELQIESEITKRMMSNIDELKSFADHSNFVCPDCGGGLWEVRDDPAHRYRCHTGHVYTEKLLHSLQDEKIEESVWVSIRMLEEKRNLLNVMLGRQGNDETALKKGYQRRIDENNMHIARLKQLLSGMVDNAAS